MSSLLDDTIAKLSGTAARMVGRAAGSSADTLRRNASAGQVSLRQAYEVARQSKQGQRMASVMRGAVIAGPVKEVAKICGRAGVAGAVVDGAVGGLNAAKYMREGKIDGTQAAKHVCAETGCGFVTSASGTAGTIAVYMVTGSMGPAAMAVGMGASIGSRYAYRKIVGETLPDEEDGQTRSTDDDSGPMEDIGPTPQE